MSLTFISNGDKFTRTIKFTSYFNSSANVTAQFVYGDGLVYSNHSASKGVFDGTTWTIGSMALNEVVELDLEVEVTDHTKALTVSWEGFADVDKLLTNNSGTWVIQYDFSCDDLDGCLPEPQTLSYEISTHTLSISEGNSVQIPNTEYRLNLDGQQIQLTDIVGSIISFIDLPDEAFDTYTISINGNYIRLIKNGTTIVSNVMMPTYTLSGVGSTVYLTNNLTGAVSSYAVPSSGGADGAITLVELDGTDLNFTGINGAFNGTIDLSGFVDTNTTYTLQLVGNELRLLDDVPSIVSTVTLPVDTNTTYTISRSGLTISLTPSSGPVQNITIPDIVVADTQPTGKTIATITKLAGTTNTIKETITGIEYDVNGNPSYVDEENNSTPITVGLDSLPDDIYYQLDLMHSESLPILLRHLNGDDPTTATSSFVIPDYIANYEDTWPGQFYWLKEWTVVAKNLGPGIDAGDNVVLKLRHINGESLATFTGTDDTINITSPNIRYYKTPHLALKTGAAVDPLANTALLGFMVEIESDPGNRIDENSEIHITIYYERGYVV